MAVKLPGAVAWTDRQRERFWVRVRGLRAEAQVDQTELARALGLDRANVSRRLQGKVKERPSEPFIDQLVVALALAPAQKQELRVLAGYEAPPAPADAVRPPAPRRPLDVTRPDAQTPRVSPVAPARAEATMSASAWRLGARADRPRHLTTLPIALVALVGVLLLAGGVVWLTRGGNSLTEPVTLESPEAPSPFGVNPPNGATLPAASNVVLSWGRTTGATEYVVEIWGGPYDQRLTSDWIATPAYQIGQMWSGHTYTWHVRARNSAGESGWSQTFMLTVSGEAQVAGGPGCLGAPVMTSPDDGQRVSRGEAVAFAWSPPSDCAPDGYTFRIGTAPEPEAPAPIVDSGTGQPAQTHTFDRPGTYYWHVRACLPCTPIHPGAWSVRRLEVVED